MALKHKKYFKAS